MISGEKGFRTVGCHGDQGRGSVLLLAMLFFGALGGSCSSWSFFLPPGPLPMEAIEKMARLCMRDLDEDEEGTDEDDVEADEDLLVSTGPGQAVPF